MRARAETARATGVRIVHAGAELFESTSYDEVSLEMIAAHAGVSLPTLLRKFGSKDGLFLACARELSGRELAARKVAPGDVRGAARVLCGRYQQLGPRWRRYIALEPRFPAVATAIAGVRHGHRDWLAQVFEPYLPRRAGPLRTRRLAALFAATEMYVWWSWREHLGLSAEQAQATMNEMLAALVASFVKEVEK